MKKQDSYGKLPHRDTQLRIAGASRYITHLTILAITVIAVILATANLPSVQSSPPDAPLDNNAAPKRSNTTASKTLVLVNASGGGTTLDDSIVRNFAPITNTVSGDSSGSASTQSRGLLTYTVQSGDTLFGIAGAFGLSPETVLWSNYGSLKDNPDMLSLGMDLIIPPTNGLITEVQAGDTIDNLARSFKVKPEDIVNSPINGLASINQALIPGRQLFVPGGQRETVVWQLPKPVQVRRSASGVPVYRVGTCGEVAIPALGTGSFTFPANAHYLSGNNFSAWHPGLDFAGHLGDPIYAADSGTVIYAGYSLNAAGIPVGYGHYVVIDHGNGYQTLYAHASQLFVSCGQQVLKGTQIAAVGSVGNSTGPHLHFEIRHGGVALNPWNILPPP
ncbi:MAG: peptidoglycan DD-metalloendopeptidase family protein [Chloroflexi bacterium]|nr:peptidoglycan DD-metalloendopeptidase family protein [Chloroflexota bacterium]